MIRFNQLVVLLAVVAVFSCQSSTEKNVEGFDEVPAPVVLPSYSIGDPVPSDLVCMVNNAFMGRKQFVVPFEGKTYYGCCDMCVERIPKDKTARTAIDPFNSKEIDKSEAYIVLVSGEGDVAYFENEQSYRQFLTAQ